VRDEAQNATATQVEAMKPNLVAVLGDEQYHNGYYSDFENSFDKYWGAFKFLQRPSPGNHEFYDNHGQTGVRGLGYFDYYNGIQHSSNGSEIDDSVTNPTNGHVVSQPAPQPEGQAGQSGQTGNGWYSYDLGAWHLISLNVECADEPGGCSPTGTWFASETPRGPVLRRDEARPAPARLQLGLRVGAGEPDRPRRDAAFLPRHGERQLPRRRPQLVS
jgi:acid phosphatase type 7